MSLPLKLNAAAAAGVYDSTGHDEKECDKRPVSNSWTPHPLDLIHGGPTSTVY